MSKIVTVIDLGSSKIAAAMARIDREGRTSLLGLESLDSRAMEGGEITDINKAAEDITSVMRKLYEHKVPKTKNVFVTVKGVNAKINISRGMVPISRTPREITKRDIEKCLNIAAMVRLPIERVVLEKLVKGFYIDGATIAVSDPLGLYAIKLEAEVFVVTVNRSKIQNITKCIDHAGFFLEGIHLSSTASFDGILEEKEKKEGVLLLDIGDSVTEKAIFKNGILESLHIVKKSDSAIFKEKSRLFESIVMTGGGALVDGLIEKTEKIFKCPTRMGLVKNTGNNLSPQDAIIHIPTLGLIRRIAGEYKNHHACVNPIHKAFRRILDMYESYF